MNFEGIEEGALKALIHDINGQLFLIRGHSEIARIAPQKEQREMSLQQIVDSADKVELLMRELRAELGFPQAVETQGA